MLFHCRSVSLVYDLPKLALTRTVFSEWSVISFITVAAETLMETFVSFDGSEPVAKRVSVYEPSESDEETETVSCPHIGGGPDCVEKEADIPEGA